MLRVVSNPKDAIGPVQTECCAALTGFYICEHISTVGESIKATFEKFFMCMQSVWHRNDIVACPGLLMAYDRGYITKELMEFVLYSLSADKIGTHKRTPNFPSLYGSGSVAERHKGLKIPEKGGLAVFYANKVILPEPGIPSGRHVTLRS